MLGDYEVHYLITKQTADAFTEGLAAGYTHKMTEDEFMMYELDTIAADIAKCIDCIAETSNATLPLPIPKDNKRWYTINDLVYKADRKTWKMYEVCRMKKYSLYDNYETEIEPGELICASDDYAEIKAAAKQRVKDTDGECSLWVVERMDNKEEL